jgi:hypothetical protein
VSDQLYIEPDDDGMYAWEDSTGLQFYGSEDELDAWAAENGYEDVPRGPVTPDTDLGGYRGRDLWSDDQTIRSQERADYMKRRLNGEFG